MGSITDWVKSTMGLNDNPEAEQEEVKKPEQETSSSPFRSKSFMDDFPMRERPGRSKVVNINTTAQLKVVVLQPTAFNDCSDIINHLKEKKPVVVNLEKVDKSVAQRILDVLAGAVYALDGTMKQVSKTILLLVPNTMGIMGDFSDELKNQGLLDLF